MENVNLLKPTTLALLFYALSASCSEIIRIDNSPPKWTTSEYFIHHPNVNNKQERKISDTITIIADSNGLFYKGIKLCPTIKNAKDGYPDFPDSMWTGFRILSIRDSLEKIKDKQKYMVKFITDGNYPFAYPKPALRAIGESGFKLIQYGTSSGNIVEFEIFSELLRDKVRHSISSPESDFLVWLSNDSIVAAETISNSNRKILFAERNNQIGLDKFSLFTSRFLDKSSQAEWIGIIPHPKLHSNNLISVAKIIQSNNTKSKIINIALYSVFSPFGDQFFNCSFEWGNNDCIKIEPKKNDFAPSN